jgi:DNA (cytosine-5)-methyltransferase 1
MKYKLGELFCGPGGIAWGALNAQITDAKNQLFSIEHAWANDYDYDTCSTYSHNICHTPVNDNGKIDKLDDSVICEDVRTLSLSKLSHIDALAFGFPCNDYSDVGEKKGLNGNYGPLYTYGVKALTRFQPKWFIAENVGGLRNDNEGKTFTKILHDMQNAGYKLYPHLYQFEDYGIPQARHRIIIVGIRNDIKVEFKVPSPEPYSNLDNTCRTAITVPPIAEDAFNNERTRQSEAVVARLNYIRPGENAFTADLPEELRLNVAGAKISQVYKRLDPDKPSYTVTGSGGGGTHIYHWEESRALTNRERARLQTFPDTYRFIGSKEGVRKQIGMAVPCQGAKIIFEAILKCFANITYPSIECNALEFLYAKDSDMKYQFDTDLENKVLINPAQEGADELNIISAYASPSMAAYHIGKLKELGCIPIKIKLIIGMCPFDGLSQGVHIGFKDIRQKYAEKPDYSDIICQYNYKMPPIHSKIYIWLKHGKPYKAFSGSANYMQSAFSMGCGESLMECAAETAYEYFQSVEKNSIINTDNEVEDYIRIYKNQPQFDYETREFYNTVEPITKEISLISKKGDVGKSSGLNWGQRPGRNPDQAYIPLPRAIATIGFFPLNRRYFTVITDDDNCMQMRVEQDGDKAITCPDDNALLGRYFKDRLGIEYGKPITVDTLNIYGRNSVKFTKLNDELFYMDFKSPNQNNHEEDI